jgi:hypothetical protein
MAPPRESPLLAMMVVRNEANRYLRPVLERLGRLVDGIVILDDASTDETPGLCRAHPKVIRFRQLNSSLFSRNEAALRSLLWEMRVELEPAWILALDADELLEEKAKTALPEKPVLPLGTPPPALRAPSGGSLPCPPIPCAIAPSSPGICQPPSPKRKIPPLPLP